MSEENPVGEEEAFVERVNNVAEYFYSSERKCWRDKLDDVVELVPYMRAFIERARDRRSWSNNEKDYFSAGKYKTFNMGIDTYKRWCAVFDYEDLRVKARNNDLTNNEIDDYIKMKKREQGRRGK